MKLSTSFDVVRHLRHCVMCLAVLIGFAFVSPVHALPMQIEASAVKTMQDDMPVMDCPPCAYCCMAPPFSERVDGNPGKLHVAIAPYVLWLDQTVGSLTVDRPVFSLPAVRLRILYCCWRN